MGFKHLLEVPVYCLRLNHREGLSAAFHSTIPLPGTGGTNKAPRCWLRGEIHDVHCPPPLSPGASCRQASPTSPRPKWQWGAFSKYLTGEA